MIHNIILCIMFAVALCVTVGFSLEPSRPLRLVVEPPPVRSRRLLKLVTSMVAGVLCLICIGGLVIAAPGCATTSLHDAETDTNTVRDAVQTVCSWFGAANAILPRFPVASSGGTSADAGVP